MVLFPTDEVYKPLLDRMRQEYGVDIWDGKLAEPYDKKRGFNKSAPKMREFNKFLSILKHHIKEYWGQTKLNDFNKFVKEKKQEKETSAGDPSFKKRMKMQWKNPVKGTVEKAKVYTVRMLPDPKMQYYKKPIWP